MSPAMHRARGHKEHGQHPASGGDSAAHLSTLAYSFRASGLRIRARVALKCNDSWNKSACAMNKLRADYSQPPLSGITPNDFEFNRFGNLPEFNR
jgi:hypothetical protein